MSYRKITAIIPPTKLEAVEQKLKDLCVPGISITRVHGYGESKNFFSNDWQSAYARIEIFIESDRTSEVSRGIMDVVHTGKPGDGVVAVLPVESFYRIRGGESASITDE